MNSVIPAATLMMTSLYSWRIVLLCQGLIVASCSLVVTLLPRALGLSDTTPIQSCPDTDRAAAGAASLRPCPPPLAVGTTPEKTSNAIADTGDNEQGRAKGGEHRMAFSEIVSLWTLWLCGA